MQNGFLQKINSHVWYTFCPEGYFQYSGDGPFDGDYLVGETDEFILYYLPENRSIPVYAYGPVGYNGFPASVIG